MADVPSGRLPGNDRRQRAPSLIRGGALRPVSMTFSTSAAPRSRRPANVRRVEVRGTAGLTHFRHSRRPVLKSTEVMAGTRVANGIMR
ncbi:hypothetical protein SAMN04487966_1044 [Micrococcus terreus]|uniref:Uncharacterized protein n=1 Tax=Micrococcus terreus TaxID=574650 RepID=A0A1I7MK35_9MICC|nr:hypothetical protein SAMN04487966_1044 [Micrococcus terreus]